MLALLVLMWQKIQTFVWGRNYKLFIFHDFFYHFNKSHSLEYNSLQFSSKRNVCQLRIFIKVFFLNLFCIELIKIVQDLIPVTISHTKKPYLFLFGRQTSTLLLLILFIFSFFFRTKHFFQLVKFVMKIALLLYLVMSTTLRGKYSLTPFWHLFMLCMNK